MDERGPAFDVEFDGPIGTLIVGVAEYGLAGLTAAEYLTTQLGLGSVGHVRASGLPAITPFEAGRPRRHTRLFSKPDLDATVLVGELAVPPVAAGRFADGIAAHGDTHGIEEVVVLSGVPIAHGPDDHRAFYVATDGYREEHLEEDDAVRPMAGGFLEGITAELMERGLAAGRPTCVLTTPVHAQAPDVEASLRLLSAVDGLYGFGIDTGPMETFAADLSKQYEELAARIESQREEGSADDRMYM